MRSRDPSEGDVEELEVALGDLTLTVRRRRSVPRDSPRSTAASSSSFTVVPSHPEPEASRPARVPLEAQSSDDWEELLLAATEASALDRAELGPHSIFVRRLHAGGEPWTAKARIARAVRAGLSARKVLRGDAACVVKSPSLCISNRIYIVLRSGTSPDRFFTTSYSDYFAKVSNASTGRFFPGTISHGFPTKAEAEAYCAAAGQAWPAELQGQN